MSKKELTNVFDEEKVIKLVNQFNQNVNSAVKNVTKNCVLLANASDGDFTEAKSRLIESQGLSGGAISQMRGAGRLYKEIKSINDVSYTKVYELARFDKAIEKLSVESIKEVYTALIGYVESATSMDVSLDYESQKEAILRAGLSNKELKIAVDCVLEDCGLKKLKAIAKKKDTTEDNTEDTPEDTTEDTPEDTTEDTPEDITCYDRFIDLSDAGKIEFLAKLKQDGYITNVSKNWR